MINPLSENIYDSSPGNEASAQADTGLHILVVEDNQDLLEMLCEMLDLIGHHPMPAGSGERALELLQQRRYDVLLTDINLPKMSGIALGKQAVEDAPDMHIIFSSGHGAHIQTYVNFPCHVLTKPFELSQIQQILDGFK
ncbi:response regulator [Undibacterium pigrum]|uniref:Response regulator receiver domain-containing protein n=1 Tax=Undibacterium pigrum TaxID=401470 RepID=A0A318JTK9_9BURK|nr:response regulator [Undibacterium pigrum]PXX47730.1 response regulator receiver domain-containing protein [Undibacterium pigrum]